MPTAVSLKLGFLKPNLSDFSTLKEHLKPFVSGSMSCEATPITLLMWKGLYHHEIAFLDDMLFIGLGKNQDIFLLPFAKDMKKAVTILKEYTESINKPLIFLAADGERFEQFKAIFGNDFIYEESRDDFEYLYLTEKLKTLSGKKYHSKRNHISAFTREHDWQYEKMTKENIVEIFDMADKWSQALADSGEDMESVMVENAAMKELLPHMDELNLRGGCIRVDGKIVAFTFGSPINNKVFDIHVEKALPEYRTAYSLINKEFILNELSDFEFVNREDDLGLEGLRKAKLSYHPDILLKKYVIKERSL